jgi:hypothetical protein
MMVIVMIVIRISIVTVTVNDGDYYYGMSKDDGYCDDSDKNINSDGNR